MFLDKQVIDKPLHKRGDKSWDERGSLHPTSRAPGQGVGAEFESESSSP